MDGFEAFRTRFSANQRALDAPPTQMSGEAISVFGVIFFS